MKKYLMLVGLMLAGMPLITSCVDNDESASVTKVRDAKAEELLSKAILNKAQAQAAEAQAILTKAMAAKTEAETELVRINAELAKVQLESARVELEAQKARLEAIKAQAELDIQRAAQELEQIAQQMKIAALQNEIDMAKKQQELLEALANISSQNRAQVVSLLEAIQESETNIVNWQADIFSKESTIALLKSDNEAVVALAASQIEELNRAIEAEEKNIEAAKALITKDSKELEAELAAIDAKYLEVAKEFLAVQEKYYEVGDKMSEIQSSDEYQNFYTEVRTFMNTFSDNNPSWAGDSYVGYYYNTDEDGITSCQYTLVNTFGDEPEEIVFATGYTYDSKGERVANTTVDVEALNKVKTTLLQKSQSILDDFNKRTAMYYTEYFYNEEVGLTSELYDENYTNKAKTYKEHLAYYTDLLKRAKYEEKVAAAEAKASEVDAANSMCQEMRKKEQTAYYTWKNSANPGVIADRQAYYEAQAKLDEFYSSEYSNFWNECYSNQFYYMIGWEQLGVDNEISDKKIEIQKIQNEIKEIEKANKVLVDTELPAAKKALETANATLEKANAGLKEKNDAKNAAHLAYVAGGEDPTSELYTKWQEAEAAYTEAQNAYYAYPDGPYWTQMSKEAAVETLEWNIAANNADIETKNGEIAGINAVLSDLESIEGLRTKYSEITAKEKELFDARDLAKKEWEASVEEAQTKDPTYLAFVEAQKATLEANAAYWTANDELWNAQNEKDKFEAIVDRVDVITSMIENAETEKADRDAQVEKLFANVEALAAAAADNNKSVEKFIQLKEEGNKLSEEMYGEDGLWNKMTDVRAEKDAIEDALYGKWDDTDAVRNPQYGNTEYDPEDITTHYWLVEPKWIYGVEALEASIKDSEEAIQACKDQIETWKEIVAVMSDNNNEAIAIIERDIKSIEAKIAAEEAILANLKAEYDAALAAIK